MQYTVNQIAKLSQVSPRTLRYYNQLGLLVPQRKDDNNYRIYGQEEVDRLQQILFYKELGVPLEQIKEILEAPDFDVDSALQSHLESLHKRRDQINTLISNLEKTIRTQKGEITMTNQEKFKGFKESYINNNEAHYGKEARSKYGDDMIDASNQRIASMNQEQWTKAQELSTQINQLLGQAIKEGDPRGKTAQKVCDLHHQWLCLYWPEGVYTKATHMALADGYLKDQRFIDYY